MRDEYGNQCCDFCGTKEGAIFKTVPLKDGCLCLACINDLEVKKEEFAELESVSFEELRPILDGLEHIDVQKYRPIDFFYQHRGEDLNQLLKIANYPKEEKLGSFCVHYKGGYPREYKEVIKVNLDFYNSYMRLNGCFNNRNSYAISYASIKKVYERIYPITYWEAYIHKSFDLYLAIDYIYEDDEYTLYLDVDDNHKISSLCRYQEILDFIKAHPQIKHSFYKEGTMLDTAIDEVIKYKKLLDLDIITQEEFEKKKKELLSL